MVFVIIFTRPKADPAERAVLVADASYFDDAVFPAFEQPSQLICKLQLTARITNRIYSMHGMKLNFSAGKSEAILNWVGP